MMHAETHAQMSLALDRALDPVEWNRLQDHLDGCASCAAEWQALNLAHQTLLDAPRLAPADGFTERVMARVTARERTRLGWQDLAGIVVFSLGAVLLTWTLLLLSPFGGLFQLEGWVRLSDTLVTLLSLSATLLALVQTFFQAFMAVTRGVPFLVLALLTLMLAMTWGLLVGGTSSMSRLTQTTEEMT